jgi:hypothetical protein
VATSAVRELAWGLRIVRTTVAKWQTCADAIPNPAARSHALAALADKRPLLDGAGLFWILPTQRRPELLKLLVVFQILANFHDHASERTGRQGTIEPSASITTLGTIMDLEQPWAGYYEQDQPLDGGYLDALAGTLRAIVAQLPRYEAARPLLIQQARRARAMDIEHTARADLAERIEQFSMTELAGAGTDHEWWELAAGAGSLMSAIVALALAADQQTTDEELHHAVDTYISVGILGTLLDNYIDQADDAVTGAHNYLRYYAEPAVAEARLGDLIERTMVDARGLRRGERHLVILSSMTTMYLTSDNARSPRLRQSTDQLVTRAGSLTRLLTPMLRAWRIVYRESDA